MIPGKREPCATCRPERFWRTPGQCITLSLNGSGTVSPGDVAQIRAQVASPRGYSPRQVLGAGPGAAAWEDGQVIRGLSARSLLDRLPLPESDPWVEWTAPDASWPTTAKQESASTWPGPHTLTVTRSAAFSGPTGHIAGVTNTSITIHRVNEDLTPYTG